MSRARGSRSHGSSSRRTTDGTTDDSHSMVGLSKALSWLLRHGATEAKIPMTNDGFVNVGIILQQPRFSRYTLDDIKKVVETNDKQRFALRDDPVAGLQIRANQGHSLEVKDLELIPIVDASKYPDVIHGTYLKYWNAIKTSGLSRMNRTHIHLAPGMPGDSGIISGMRTSAEVLIYIDMRKAIQDGILFFTSANNVVLTSGNTNGFLECKYFAKVINRKTGEILPLQ